MVSLVGAAVGNSSRRSAPKAQAECHAVRGWALFWGTALLLGISLVCFQPGVAKASGPADVPPPSAGSIAASSIRIQRERVQVMPEFDEPRVLVIIQGRLAEPSGGFPQTLAVRVPTGAQINRMATINLDDGSTIDHPYEIKVDASDPLWSVVTYSLDSAHFFCEYYYDPLRRSATDQDFIFTYSSLHPIDELVLEIQEPEGASQFTTDPPPTETRLDPVFGLRHHQIQAGGLPSGGSATVRIAYHKSSPLPSLAQSTISRTGSGARTAGDRSADFSLWLILILSLVVPAGIAGAIWYQARSDGLVLASATEASAIETCRLCGTIVGQQARFCRYCGAPIRGRSQRSTPGGAGSTEQPQAPDRDFAVTVRDSDLSA